MTPWPRGLLVARRAVDLAGEEQSGQALDLQRGQQLARIDVIVLDGVAETLDADLLQAGDGAQERLLHVLRQRGGDAVGVDGVVVQALGFEENLMRRAVAEAHDLVLDGRAIARAGAADLAGVDGRAVEVGADDAVGFLGGVRDVAGDLRRLDALGEERERHGRIVAVLGGEARPVDGFAVEARGCAGFQAAHGQAEGVKPVRQPDGRRLAHAAGRNARLADVDEALEERARGDDHRAAAVNACRPP